MTTFVLFLLFLVISFGVICFQSYVFSLVWQWFIVPLGVIPIGMAHAAGILLIIALLKINLSQKNEEYDKLDSERKFLHLISLSLSSAFVYLIAWGQLWIIHHFFMS